jgi:hypothetical protein
MATTLRIVFAFLFLCASCFAQTKPSYLQITNKPVVFVGDYGAVGDGATDDSDALASAALALGEGDTLLFSSGKTYAMSSSVHIDTNNVTVDFNGAKIIPLNQFVTNNAWYGAPFVFTKLTAGEYTTFVTTWATGDTLENILVKNYWYEGNLDAGTDPATGDLKTDGAIASGAYHAISFLKAKNVTIENANITNVYAAAINLQGCSGNNLVKDSRIGNVFYHAISSSQAGAGLIDRSNTAIVDCIFENIGGYVADFHQANDQQPTQLSIVNCVASNVSLLTKNQGYLTYPSSWSDKLIVSGCTIGQTKVYFDAVGDAYESPIYASSWKHMVIDGNLFSGCINSVLSWFHGDGSICKFTNNMVYTDVEILGTASGTIYPNAKALISCSAVASLAAELTIDGNTFVGPAGCLLYPLSTQRTLNVIGNYWGSGYRNDAGIVRSLGNTTVFNYKNNFVQVATNSRAVSFTMNTGKTVRRATLRDNVFQFTANDFPFSYLATDTLTFAGNTFFTDEPTYATAITATVASASIYEAPTIASYAAP